MKLDLHNHTSHSADSLTKPETMLKTAAKKGLVVAVTDHNTTAAWKYFEAQKGAKGRVVFGEEITATSSGKIAGHMLGLFLNAPVKATEYPDVIDEIKKQGAVVAVAHPFDCMRGAFRNLDEVKNKISLIEVLNARSYKASMNSSALEYAEKHGIAKCAGSDSHTPEEIGAAYVEVEASGIEEARRLLLKNKSRVCGSTTGLVPHIKTKLAMMGVMKPK